MYNNQVLATCPLSYTSRPVNYALHTQYVLYRDEGRRADLMLVQEEVGSAFSCHAPLTVRRTVRTPSCSMQTTLSARSTLYIVDVCYMRKVCAKYTQKQWPTCARAGKEFGRGHLTKTSSL